MSQDVARAWKDPEYRATLSAGELAAIPQSPIGGVELTDIDLAGVDAGTHPTTTVTITVTFEGGCYTWNSTFCNGTCALLTNGCCGGG